MNPADLTLPRKGFTKNERAWLAQLIEAIKTVHAVAGRNISISEHKQGQMINADDCAPCGS